MRHIDIRSRLIPIFAWIAILSSGFAPLTAGTTPKKWKVDTDHASVSFEIVHFFTPVKARFLDFKGTFRLDPEDLTRSPSFEFEVNVKSVATDSKKRDKHLMSDNFFDVAKWPKIQFSGNNVVQTGDNTYTAIGKLTIRDVVREFEVPFTVLGIKDVKGMIGSTQVMGIRARAELNRTDFGVGNGSWAATAVVGDTVNVDILMELK